MLTQLNSKLINIFNTAKLNVEYTMGTNWSVATEPAIYLIGNILRVYVNITRSTAVSGNITNESVITLKIAHNGRIEGALAVTASTAINGGVGNGYVSLGECDDEYLTITLVLSATATSLTAWSSYLVIPVKLNLDAY